MKTANRFHNILKDLSRLRKCNVTIFSSTLQRAKETTEVFLQEDGITNFSSQVIFDDKYREVCLIRTRNPTYEKELFRVCT